MRIWWRHRISRMLPRRIRCIVHIPIRITVRVVWMEIGSFIIYNWCGLPAKRKPIRSIKKSPPRSHTFYSTCALLFTVQLTHSLRQHFWPSPISGAVLPRTLARAVATFWLVPLVFGRQPLPEDGRWLAALESSPLARADNMAAYNHHRSKSLRLVIGCTRRLLWLCYRIDYCRSWFFSTDRPLC